MLACFVLLGLLIHYSCPWAFLGLCFIEDNCRGVFPGFLSFRVDIVLVSRGAAGGDVRVLSVLVITPRSCASYGSILSCLVSASVDEHYQPVDKAC